MNAPIIIIPMEWVNVAFRVTDISVSEKSCRHLVLDAGHIAVVSALANKDELREIQSKRGRQYSEDDFKQLEDLMYDRFSLRLEDTQVRLSAANDFSDKVAFDGRRSGSHLARSRRSFGC